ncbi:glycosyltransferase family 2 protein [Flavihumibacter profundi]|jgi:glycosyltransferase involved in cell wall biosynthesis|uniref:glycosyltransferase family 2 protein n=1 Tax=Flavihumibacter profundi TaxID=2716883 RepID=UPI001CC75B53|nr:glycosyltransferase family 2 protein [Flavihumibacter profundi]MBZ5856366.1 glycosyltransferase family 2 protein [Flavihumibacter profundi]
MSRPLISICIPAYQRINYLERLLRSIEQQTFRDFEIIVTDDSPDNSVALMVDKYHHLNIRYKKNEVALGTPANWNSGIKQCRGEWIKLIHDDDWFSSPDSLQIFADHTKMGKKFIFSAYANHFEDGKTPVEQKFLPDSWARKILREPMTLLAYNVIGPPSVIMVHRSITELYDEALKWRVDMEYYVRLLNMLNGYEYINDVLVNVGVSESQVTQSCIYKPNVELPEGKRLLDKHGDFRLKNIWVYDAWWRLLRNMDIRSNQQLEQYAPGDWPLVIKRMVKDLSKIPSLLLRFGILSKSFMFVSYLKNKSTLSHHQ